MNLQNQMVFTTLPVGDLMEQVREAVRAEIQAEKQKEQAEKLMTPQETADLLRVSVVTIWQWEKQGRITKHSLGGRTYFKYSEVIGNLETLKRYRKPVLGKEGSHV